MEAEEKAPPAPVPVAVSPFYAKLAEVDAAVKDVAPQFGCYDQTDPKSCQKNRSATTDEGTFITHDWGDDTYPLLQAAGHRRLHGLRRRQEHKRRDLQRLQLGPGSDL
jgi:hypothetical protein